MNYRKLNLEFTVIKKKSNPFSRSQTKNIEAGNNKNNKSNQNINSTLILRWIPAIGEQKKKCLEKDIAKEDWNYLRIHI
jgi:hypothetical protein